MSETTKPESTVVIGDGPSLVMLRTVAIKAEVTEQAFAHALREVLWMALCYNDHHFQPDVLLEKAQRVAQLLKVETVDDANELLARLKTAQP